MRTVRFLLEKEFRQIFRNRPLTAMIAIVPLMQLLILPLAADYEVKNISLSVVDHDHSAYSRKLVDQVVASGYFRLAGYDDAFRDGLRLVEEGTADLILEIPAGFERNLVRERSERLFVAVDAINGVKAGLGSAYLNRIISNYQFRIGQEKMQSERPASAPVIDITFSNWFNPYMNYYLFMVPGILAVLVTLVGGYMSALNIVREKEIGTIEQINVTPIRKHHFILGKLVPFWVLGMIVFTIGLWGVANLVYGVAPQGSVVLLYGFLSLYLLAVLGFGLLISTYCQTQQQAMSLSFFFVMIFILMSGLFTPVDSMPGWARMITRLNPVTYFIEVMRMIVLKGSGFSDIWSQFLIIFLFALLFSGWAILNYRKTA